MTRDLSPISALIAIEEIKRLKACFFIAVDDKDWETYATLFTDDARFEVAAAFDDGSADLTESLGGAAAAVGGKAMATLLAGLLADTRTIHIGYMPVITMTGADAAEAIWPVEDWLWSSGAEPSVLHGFGRYHERYAKVEAGWRIARLEYKRERFT